jgi:asparagine synthase (glutamine-hydrolysing)
LGGGSPTRWRSVLNSSLSPFLPRPLYRSILRATGRDSASALDIPVLRAPFRAGAESELKAEHFEIRPPRSFFDFRREMLFAQDNSGKMSLARFGVDERDPTADRRLVEFCFSLPIEALISGNQARPLFQAAMSDRIAPQVLSSRLRGYQTADWHETITKTAVSNRFDQCKRHALVNELIDVDQVESVIERWPTSGWEDRKVMGLFRNDLLRILSVADFIVVNF